MGLFKNKNLKKLMKIADKVIALEDEYKNKTNAYSLRLQRKFCNMSRVFYYNIEPSFGIYLCLTKKLHKNPIVRANYGREEKTTLCPSILYAQFY